MAGWSGVFVRHLCSTTRWKSEQIGWHVMFFCFQSNETNHLCCAFWVVFHNDVHSWWTCLLEDYPRTSGMVSLRPLNHVIFSDMILKNKCRSNLPRASAEILPLVCCCVFSFYESCLCVSWHQGDWGCLFLCHHPLKGEVIKSSMGATSCFSLLHFEAFYLEMNRRPLHNEGGEEKFLLKAEDVGGCAIAYRHLVWNSPVVPVYRIALLSLLSMTWE